jgi:hypothetical protein
MMMMKAQKWLHIALLNYKQDATLEINQTSCKIGRKLSIGFAVLINLVVKQKSKGDVICNAICIPQTFKVRIYCCQLMLKTSSEILKPVLLVQRHTLSTYYKYDM